MKPEIGQTLTLPDGTYKITKVRTVYYSEIDLTLDLIDDSGNEKIVSLVKSVDMDFNDPDNLNHFDNEQGDLELWIKSEYY
jgi:hypothetical protein